MEGKVTAKRDHSVSIQMNVTGDICRQNTSLQAAEGGGAFLNSSKSTVIEQFFSLFLCPSSDIHHTGIKDYYRGTN